MGRTKVQLKLVEDPVERNTAYHRMKECLNLKAGELSVPCGARVLTMCVNPRTGDVESWPDSGQEVSDILETYRNPGTRHKEVLDLPNYLKGQIRKVHAELKKTCNVLLPRVDDMMKSVAERIWLLESGNREIAVEESLRQENIAYWQGVLQDCSSGFNVFDEPAKFDQFEYQDADVFNYGLDTFVFNPALESTTGVPGDDDWMVNGNKGASCTMNHGVDEPAKFDQPEYDHGDVFSNGRDTFVFNPNRALENTTGVGFPGTTIGW